MEVIFLFFGMVFFYSLISERIDQTYLTAPIVFTLYGFAVFWLMDEPLETGGSAEVLLTIAELGLVLLLFTDGSHISQVFEDGLRSLPGRLLSTGMVLTILLGAGAAMVLFDELTIWHAGILAAILAPTDAGLGQAIVSSPKVPKGIRESLNVEAGLNDGLAVPFLLFFIALASSAQDVSFGRFFLEQFCYGVAIGLIIGWAGSRSFDAAQARGWVGERYRQLGFTMLPIMCVILSHETGASMFIAAFVAGLAVQRNTDQSIDRQRLEFTENWGQLINLTVFFLFGMIAGASLGDLEPVHFVYAALSLTVIRMLPVAVSMIGAGLGTGTLLFMGWFGPRGLASIVLGLVYLERVHGEIVPTIHLCLIATVLCSIILHGLSAKPGTSWFRQYVDGLPDRARERREQ
ncbi:sodium/proton antiporter (CPA1 family) [Rhodovulum imhoffii]|uniref:Sodium/proton antiporter (CPA1 family) n=1 Tax=Rhodovulum imhoffii TaxID=365340 RepID=A0A2T5BNI1_9RHOB|nr:cation:proton antiporter [Rhodovulum imhoffii]MBK5933135.1 hypothetical protein [Rhodovulum imhoffii]PTN00546.1 sodium/proton antiporter (CPA1 family) [Rhodovulum imhoffii]